MNEAYLILIAQAGTLVFLIGVHYQKLISIDKLVKHICDKVNEHEKKIAVIETKMK